MKQEECVRMRAHIMEQQQQQLFSCHSEIGLDTRKQGRVDSIFPPIQGTASCPASLLFFCLKYACFLPPLYRFFVLFLTTTVNTASTKLTLNIRVHGAFKGL